MTNQLMIKKGESKMNELTVRNYDEVEKVARAMVASGFFSDTKQISQAIVKIMAGAELGFGPFASMNGVYIIQGRPSFGANMMASAVKASGRYNYRVIEMTDTRCVIIFFEDGKEIGRSSFTIEDAKKAGTKNLDKFPRNMLFARAMSNGVRWYTPNVTNGSAVYTPEELGAEVDEEGNVVTLPDNVIEVTEQVEDEQSEETVYKTDDEAIQNVLIETSKIVEPKIRPYMEMSLEHAEAFIGGTDGKKYGDCTDEELQVKLIGLNKALLDGKNSASRKEIYYHKRDACLTILRAREDGSVQ